MYFFAWEAGLKTTYYLRTLGATQIEKSTVNINNYGVQPKWMKSKSESSAVAAPTCSILDPECEACQ
jgi:ribonucleoside-diphosphate reductase alpha chain